MLTMLALARVSRERLQHAYILVDLQGPPPPPLSKVGLEFSQRTTTSWARSCGDLLNILFSFGALAFPKKPFQMVLRRLLDERSPGADPTAIRPLTEQVK